MSCVKGKFSPRSHHNNNLAWLFLPDVLWKRSLIFGNVSRFHFKAINSSDSCTFPHFCIKNPRSLFVLFCCSFVSLSPIDRDGIFFLVFFSQYIPFSCVPVWHPEILSSYFFCRPFLSSSKRRRRKKKKKYFEQLQFTYI